jgi:hypothetical protein
MSAAQSLHRFQAKSALQPRREPPCPRIDLVLPRGGQMMRWKISHGNHDHGGHDPRQIDLIAIIALLIVIVAAFKFYSDSFESAPSTTAFIVPSQSVHW